MRQGKHVLIAVMGVVTLIAKALRHTRRWFTARLFTTLSELSGAALMVLFADSFGERWAILTAAVITLAVGIMREFIGKG